MERRLAAILAAEVVSYSRLMETDDAGTLVAFQDRPQNILQSLVAKHQCGGRFRIRPDAFVSHGVGRW